MYLYSVDFEEIERYQRENNIPLLHIADLTAKKIRDRGLYNIGLLGTKYTMEEDFYISRLEAQGIHILVPAEEDCDLINRVIFEELCLGKVNQTSRQQYKKIKKICSHRVHKELFSAVRKLLYS